MKKLIIVLIFLAGFITMEAQREYYVPTTGDIEQFFKSKTLVILDENPMSEYNFTIQDAVKSEWKLTEYSVISNAEFASKSKESSYSFIYTTILNFEKDRTDTKFIFLHLSLGGDNLTLDDLKDMVSLPLGYYGEDPGNYMYKIPVLIKFIQAHMKLIKENPGMLKTNIFSYYNRNIPEIHGKTLYILKEDLPKDLASESKVKALYGHPFKIVTKEELQSAIDERDSKVAFLHKAGPKAGIKETRCYKIILGADDGMIYYYDYHRISDKNPNGFLKSDFSAINK